MLITSFSTQRLKIIVLGYIVRGPLGGLAWHHLQYVIGLSELGHDVYFFEDSDDFPSCYDPNRHVTDTDPRYGLGFISKSFDQLNLDDRWAYYDAHIGKWHGPAGTHALDICSSADLLLNVSGVNPMRPWFLNIPKRALIDTDPVFTQVAHLTNTSALERAERHTSFLSFAENIGSANCTVPEDGFAWQPTRQPVVLDQWPVTVAPSEGAFTTVMQWDSYKSVENNDVHYGMKSESFEHYLKLPKRTNSKLELAIGSSNAPRELLESHGWHLRDPLEITRDPWTYQNYIQNSRGEFSIAKHGYVISHSGWFSERSAAYLASGRPVVIQDTGFSDWMNVGEGVWAFNSPDEALKGLSLINDHYGLHCEAARTLAEDVFDSSVVLGKLLDDIFS
ncbi:hypothetical protein ACFL3I_05535 [Pseudomonadota bacterium]